ncbi:interferon-related developmental regulator domain containing protein [Nitzschia inconspicua]|uniref:Interferon-related developmental regulator domain containing protein n=1 Tax=Nitzschia inconspicua TaxID=303405 RepID=A0A9K3K9R7_9STRA|nr:interferon-related developmental regulator domain containing protein [Nitzschia inconspicua]KAG7362421.1 interferon-related developmental regulator domain containing protein [Nitzschia inconspicua]
MPKKPRSARRRNKGRSGTGDSDEDERSYDDDMGTADYLSETHTIEDNVEGSHAAGSTLASMDDDLDWDMDDDDDPHLHSRANDSSDAALAAERKRQQKVQSILSSSLDFPQEKRSSKREVLLKQWFKALTQYTTPSSYGIVEQYAPSLIEACCQHALMKSSSSPAEQYAACRVLEALGTLPVLELYEQTSQRLIRTVQSTHRATPVRAAALRALGMIVFCATEVDEVVSEFVMDLCETILLAEGGYRGQNPTPDGLCAAAFQVWTVLATTLHYFYVSGQDDATTGRGLPLLKKILECLEHENTVETALQLKEAAGQAVVYIHDARVMLGSTQVENATDAQYKLGSWEGTEYDDVIADTTQMVYQLAHASGHYMSKKAKKEQRQVFREYLSMLQDNEDPVHVIQFRGSATLELTSWKDVIAVEFLRRCLQGGFQHQLMTNPILQNMLGANGAALQSTATYSQLEKRQLWSKNSEMAKEKDQQRNKGRDKRQNINNHFLTADGEDI